jgi:starvation-inducible DNA-binding protein
MYGTANDISKERWSELTALMNQRLADAVDLQMQMKQAQWSPTWTRLPSGSCNWAVSPQGRRVWPCRARGSPNIPLAIADGMTHVEGVARALSTFGKEARATIDEANALDDADTANLFTEISRGIDQ